MLAVVPDINDLTPRFNFGSYYINNCKLWLCNSL